MTKRLLMIIVGVLLGAVLLIQIAAAMTSVNYRLDWYTPMTTGGGGVATSAHYAVNLTIGQTAYNTSTSANYQAGLGYWAGLAAYHVYLPIVIK